MESNCFKELHLIEQHQDMDCEGVLADGRIFSFRAYHNSACCYVWEEAQPHVYLSYFEAKHKYKMVDAPPGGFVFEKLPLIAVEDLLGGFARQFLDGNIRWDEPGYYPGDAYFEALVLDKKIKQAMLDNPGQTFKEPSSFGSYILSDVDDGNKWIAGDLSKNDTAHAPTFVSFSKIGPTGSCIKLCIADWHAFDGEESRWRVYDADTIIYAPKTSGFYSLVVIRPSFGTKVPELIDSPWESD